jgi:4-aminobutyrate aminotransferase/(S)-3-amino-2-methylpropionate transaminase
MVAMELVIDGDPARPDAALAKALCSRAIESGLILLSCGVRGNVIRILVPLTIEMKHLEEGLTILADSFGHCAGP